MSCCCDSPNPLLGGLMGALGLASNIEFRLGFNADFGLWVTTGEEEEILSEIARCLRNTGRFRSVSVRRLSGTFNPYYQVSGQTNVGFAQEEDLVNLISNTIRFNCDRQIGIDSVDELIIDSIPQAYVGDPNVKQPGSAPYDAVPRTQTSNADGISFWDGIANEFDIPKKEAQMLIIGGGALLLILLTRR